MNPRSGPQCSKCGKEVKAEDNFRLRYGEVVHTSCDNPPPQTPIEVENKK